MPLQDYNHLSRSSQKPYLCQASVLTPLAVGACFRLVPQKHPIVSVPKSMKIWKQREDKHRQTGCTPEHRLKEHKRTVAIVITDDVRYSVQRFVVVIKISASEFEFLSLLKAILHIVLT